MSPKGCGRHMKSTAIIALGAVSGLVPTMAAAQSDEDISIVVTATGQAQDRNASGQAISVVDQATIERSQARSVTDILNQLPSVRSNSNGSLGAVTGVSLRGAETGQTLVLLDGVRINDPSSTANAVDFGNLLIGNIRRVEVLRGSNAIPYGSDAIGGVIDLSTRDEGAADGLALRVSGEGGYAGTAQGVANLGWRAGASRADFGITALRTDGISSAAPRFGATERDGLRNITMNARVETPVTDGVAIDLRTYFVDARLDYDSFFGTPADSPDTSQFRQVTSYAGLNVSSFGGALVSRLSFTYLTNRRDYRSMPDAAPDFGYRGTGWRLDYQGKLGLAAHADLIFGLTHDAPEYRFFGFGSDETHGAHTNSAHAMLILRPLDRLSLTGGLRHDDHSQFGGVTTFGANANWGLADGRTQLRASYGEGFRTPSLYQLYDSFSGNAALAPERSNSADIGIDRRFAAGRGRASFTLFTRTTRNQIDFDLLSFRYGNLARTRAQGIEAELVFSPVDQLDLSLAYSLVDTRDRSPGSLRFDQHLSRRPVHGLSASIDKAWRFGLKTGATLRTASASVDPAAPPGSLDGYALLDLRASLPIGQGIALYGRLENAFDRQYETAYGYATYGRAAYGGLRIGL